MQEDELSDIAKEQYCQRIQEETVFNLKLEGPTMQPHNVSVFLIILTFACEALIACARQLDIMDEESGNGDYGTKLASSANAIKIAIKEGRILAARPSVLFTQLSHIVEKTTDNLRVGMYSVFFDAVAKTFLKCKTDEQVTVNMWLTALTSANATISKASDASIGDRTILDALIPAEHKLKDALDSGLNPISAFGEAVQTAETSAMQTVYMLNSQSANSGKTFKYPDPGAHAVGIWMRGAYEGVKLKLGCEYNM